MKWDGIERTRSASAIGSVFLGGIRWLLHKLIPAPTGSCEVSPSLLNFSRSSAGAIWGRNSSHVSGYSNYPNGLKGPSFTSEKPWLLNLQALHVKLLFIWEPLVMRLYSSRPSSRFLELTNLLKWLNFFADNYTGTHCLYMSTVHSHQTQMNWWLICITISVLMVNWW